MALARLHIPFFGGEFPATPPRRLESHDATIAVNCLLDDGDLTSLNAPLETEEDHQIIIPFTDGTIYLYEHEHWFSWKNKDVDVVPSPILQDDFKRIYFTGDGKPQVTTNEMAIGGHTMPDASYDLGIPAPIKRPFVEITKVGEEDPEGIDDDETRYYVYTYVSGTGEEGAQSPLSTKLVLPTPLEDEVTVTVTAPAINTFNITHINVYRSATSAEDAVWLLVGQLPLHQTSFIDNKLDSELGPLLETFDYIPPPETLRGLVGMDGGMLAGFTDSTLCVSEAFLPYAWPKRYQHKTKWPIVGIAAVAGGAVVCTKGEPYIFAGTSPDAMMLETTGAQQACISKRSIVAMDGFVLYASPDGIVSVTGSGAELISDAVIKPKQWRALKPESIHAYYHEGEYIAFYGGQGVSTRFDRGGFILNPKRKDIRFFNFYAGAAFKDISSDKFYLMMPGHMSIWGEGEPLVATWRSKLFETPIMSFSLCQVLAPDIEGIKVTILTDDNVLHSVTLSNEYKGIFWLPAGLYSRWQIEIETTKPIHSITLANTHQELD